jgi:hypothetical protein
MISARLRCLVGFSCGVGVSIAVSRVVAAAPVYEERGGFVVIEAEHATDNVGPWEEVEGRNATAAQRGTTPDRRLRRASEDNPFVAGLGAEIELPSGTMLPWGFAGEQARVGWTLGHDARKAAVFGYERGAAMPAGSAAARRVLVPPLSPEAPAALDRIVTAALRWAADGSGMQVLFTSNQPELVDEEQRVLRRLEALGYAVKSLPAAQATPKVAEGCAFLFIPAAVRVEKIGTRFNEMAVPIVTEKSHIAQFLGMVPPPRASRPGDNAILLRDGAEGDSLRYLIHFPKPGEFRVWALGQNSGAAGTEPMRIGVGAARDAKGAELLAVRLARELTWSSAVAVSTDGGAKEVPGVITIDRAGWHALHVVNAAENRTLNASAPSERRYPNWRLDKLVLSRDASWKSQGDGPQETLASTGLPPLPPELAVKKEWRPGQVWSLKAGYVAIEAEDIDHHSNWRLLTEPAGATGRGYLEWRGPNRSKSIEDLGGNDDHLHVRQGPAEEWLILRVLAEKAGAYRIDVRNHHRMRDGDNDLWFARVGQRGSTDAPIKRLVDSHRDGAGFTWLDSSPAEIELQAGLNEFYLGGRSVGFGVDRIVFYARDNEEARRRALDPATSPARAGRLYSALHDFQPVQDGAFVPYYRDVRSANPERHALAIDAKQYRAKFAAAELPFEGAQGDYDLTLRTLTENDGESTYRLVVGERVIGEFQNPPGSDGAAAMHTWRGVALRAGDRVRVESNTHSNGKIPEAGAFAWARGRWTGLLVAPAR